MTYADFYNSLEQLNYQLKQQALSLTNELEMARVLYQETTFRVLENRTKYQSKADLEHWLAITMIHLYKNKFQRPANHQIMYDYSGNKYSFVMKKQSPNALNLAYA